MQSDKIKIKALVLAICVLFLVSAYSWEFATGYTASVDGWSKCIRLNPKDSALSCSPEIAVDTNNNIHITWADYRYPSGSYNDIYYTKLDNDGNTLVDDTRLTHTDYDSCHSPAIAVDTNNNVHITWADWRDPEPGPCSEIYYTKLDNDGNTLVDDTRLTHTDYEISSSSPAIAVDTNNNVHITWKDWRHRNNEIYYTKLDNDGNTLVDDTRVTTDSASSSSPAIAVDTNNNVHITWWDDRDGNREIYYTKLDNKGNTLVDDTRLTTDSAWSYYPRIAVDTNNNVHITWQDGRGRNLPSGYEIYYTKLDNNGNTLVDDTRLTADSIASAEPAIAVDTNNYVHITWVDWRRGDSEIYYTELDNKGNTLVNDTYLSPSGDSPEPAIAVDTNNYVHITWESGHYPKKHGLGIASHINYKRTLPAVKFLDKDDTTVIVQISNLPSDITMGDISVQIISEGNGNMEDDATIDGGVFTQTYTAPEDFVIATYPKYTSREAVPAPPPKYRTQNYRKIDFSIKINGMDIEIPNFYLVKLPSATSEPTPTPKSTPLIQGFELAFAIAGLLTVAYLLRRRE